MSLQYLLDGYNIIKNMPTLADQTLENGRKGLVTLIETCHPQGSPNNQITVVFDGKSDVFSPPHSSHVKVVFTSDETADDKIKRIVSKSSNAKQIVVVTDDRDIKYSVRPLGACVIGVKEFCQRLKDKSSSVKGGGRERPRDKPGKVIPKTVEHKINSELEKIWVKKSQ